MDSCTYEYEYLVYCWFRSALLCNKRVDTAKLSRMKSLYPSIYHAAWSKSYDDWSNFYKEKDHEKASQDASKDVSS